MRPNPTHNGSTRSTGHCLNHIGRMRLVTFGAPSFEWQLEQVQGSSWMFISLWCFRLWPIPVWQNDPNAFFWVKFPAKFWGLQMWPHRFWIQPPKFVPNETEAQATFGQIPRQGLGSLGDTPKLECFMTFSILRNTKTRWTSVIFWFLNWWILTTYWWDQMGLGQSWRPFW